MKLYLSTITLAMLIISAANIFFDTAPSFYIISSVIWCVILQIVLDSLAAYLIHILPEKYFDVGNPHFEISKREQKIYRFLKVRKWKDHVLELGGLGGFSKKTLKDPNSPGYIEKFIIECNKGVIVHRISYFLGFLAMLSLNGICVYTIALPVATVNLILNILPTLVLRYNTPALKLVYSHMKKKSGKREAVKTE
jgi:hypothetical protein